ncbi:hypothetical protein SESBI_21824 [Sesbania bispinosa]|nr:hypothetical protein SESBI_21824 [Sesbania bispinosa]
MVQEKKHLYQQKHLFDDFGKPVWLDAKINSIKGKPHGSGCSCEYYVKIYATQGSLGVSQRTLSKDVIVVGIDQICVLQRLERNCNEDQSYRWNLAEDCSAISKTKLLKGKFFFDISWLADTSVIKQVSFYARSVNNKIVYQKLGNDDSPSIRPGSFINVLNLTSDKKHILKYCVSRIEFQTWEQKPECYLGFEDYDDSKEEVGLFTLPSEESEQKHCLTQNVADDSEKRKEHKRKRYKKPVVVLALPSSADMFSNLKNKRSTVAKTAKQGDDISLSKQLGNDIRMLTYAQDNPPLVVQKRMRLMIFQDSVVASEPGNVKGGRIRFWKMWVLKIGGEGETLVKEL